MARETRDITGGMVISIEGLWKSHSLELEALRRLWCLAKVDWRGALAHRQRWALRDINPQVHRVETLGLIERDGAGKSTLSRPWPG